MPTMVWPYTCGEWNDCEADLMQTRVCEKNYDSYNKTLPEIRNCTMILSQTVMNNTTLVKAHLTNTDPLVLQDTHTNITYDNMIELPTSNTKALRILPNTIISNKGYWFNISPIEEYDGRLEICELNYTFTKQKSTIIPPGQINTNLSFLITHNYLKAFPGDPIVIKEHDKFLFIRLVEYRFEKVKSEIVPGTAKLEIVNNFGVERPVLNIKTEGVTEIKIGESKIKLNITNTGRIKDQLKISITMTTEKELPALILDYNST